MGRHGWLLRAAALLLVLGAAVPARAGGAHPSGSAPAPASAAIVAQWLHVVYQLFGPSIEPFTEGLRQTFVLQLNWTLVEVDLEDIEILSVEEFLPLTGPSAETLMRISGSPHKHSSLSGAEVAAAPGPDARTRGAATTASYLRSLTGRRMLQAGGVGPQPAPGRAPVTPASAAEPHVQITLRIATDSGESAHVVQELVSSSAPNGELLWRLQSAGMGVERLLLASRLLYNSGSPTPAPALVAGGAPAQQHLHALLPGDPEVAAHPLSSTAVGLIAGVCMLAALVAAALALLAVRRARLMHAARAAEAARWAPGSLSGKLSNNGSEPAGAAAGEPWRFGGAGGGELISFSDLQFSRVIGQGSFGRVFLGKWRETTVAIKLLNEPGVPPGAEIWDAPDPAALPAAQRPKVDEGLLEGLRREAGLMAALRHPNVVLFLGACPDPPCMVTAFCARGSLLDVLARARTSPAAAADLGWGRRLALALEAAKGMLYLHSRSPPVLHRDLKSANLLVDKDWHARLADFNLSRVMDSALGGPASEAGRRATSAAASISATNPRWLAPEVLAGRSYDCSCDVYSFGIILWELLTWRVPWEEYEGPWQVVIAVVDRGLRPEVPPESALPTPPLRQHGAYIALMRRCWATDPAQRPAFDAVICDLRGIVDAEVLAQEQDRRGADASACVPRSQG
ncbi:hypothetical protein WJX81_007609 [Elliptochloris bilobata]|uniref:Protein kinase domain-containing protein n=1 Tax=Elliptochloris bilobata TaxID=381761 RepID=A0AAW1QHP0_9CHLO